MKFGYYPGCSLSGTAREFDESLKALASAVDLQLEEIPDWNCCGSTAAHNLSHLLSLALPARVLALAEQHGLNEILAPCSACYSRLINARHQLMADEELRKEVNDLIEMNFTGSAKVLNVLEALFKVFADESTVKVVKPFDHKVACYSGCLLVRPAKVVNFDRPEDPQAMDDLIRKFGATPIDWPHKVECCGAGLTMARTDLVCKLSQKIIESAEKRGAEAIVVACPMCHANLDMRRADIEAFAGKKYSIPVIYITQAIGLAMGLGEKQLGLNRHLVPVVFPEKTKAAPAAPEAQPAQKAEE